MYRPDMFREDRPDVLRDAVRRIGFATLVTHDADGGLEANHLPMLLQDGEHGQVLRGHVARANPVWKKGEGGALAIFLGPHAYVSPNWYPSKAETGKAVPTWNYITVHARGVIGWIDDAVWLRAHVGQLSAAHEAGREVPWMISDAPASYIDGMVRAIVGFELSIETLEGKWKLSQNRDEADHAGAREGLRRDGREDVARLMDRPEAKQK
ncbi:MAG TPA: FMN-binding negative transcriptional regulator [Rhizomicrobium sp.]|nr:FMN-binding negative transcriptional regulator [Rhizomicrobium sp.]